MSKSNIMKTLAITIYGLGIACVVYLVLEALIMSDYVSNPDAMLPITCFDGNMIVLGIGFIPMAASCLFMIYIFEIHNRIKKILLLIPGAITAIPFVLGVLFILCLLLLGIRDMTVDLLGLA